MAVSIPLIEALGQEDRFGGDAAFIRIIHSSENGMPSAQKVKSLKWRGSELGQLMRLAGQGSGLTQAVRLHQITKVVAEETECVGTFGDQCQSTQMRAFSLLFKTLTQCRFKKSCKCLARGGGAQLELAGAPAFHEVGSRAHSSEAITHGAVIHDMQLLRVRAAAEITCAFPVRKRFRVSRKLNAIVLQDIGIFPFRETREGGLRYRVTPHSQSEMELQSEVSSRRVSAGLFEGRQPRRPSLLERGAGNFRILDRVVEEPLESPNAKVLLIGIGDPRQ